MTGLRKIGLRGLSIQICKFLLVGILIYAGSVSAAPRITAISPTSGEMGASVTITGANFSYNLADNIVFFGAMQAMVTSASATSLTVVVPSGATYAPIRVTVGARTAESNKWFLPTFSGNGAISSQLFTSPTQLVTGSKPRGVITADVDGDGKPDLVVAGDNANEVSVFRNTGNRETLSFADRVDLTTNGPVKAVVAGDLDGDGMLDIVASDINNDVLVVFRNTSSGPGVVNFSRAGTFATSNAAPQSVKLADMDGDGRLDMLVTTAGSSGPISIFLNQSTGVGSISMRASWNWNTGNNDVLHLEMADMDGDGKPDIVASHYGATRMTVRRNTSTPGTLTFDGATYLTTGFNMRGVAVGDLDEDGRLDVAVTDRNANRVRVFKNNSSPETMSFIDTGTYTTRGQDGKVTFGDVNGDGRVELIVASRSAGYVSIFTNTSVLGSVQIGARRDYYVTAAGGPEYVSVGDLNDDGRPEIITADNTASNTISILTNRMPLANAGADLALETEDVSGAFSTLDGSASHGPTGDTNYSWSADNIVFDDPTSVTPTAQFPLGTTTVTLTVTSSAGSCTDQVLVSVERVGLFAHAGYDRSYQTQNISGYEAQLDGSASMAPEGESLSYFWSAPGVVFDDPTSVTPKGVFPEGETTATLVVTSTSGKSSSDDVVISVEILPTAKAGENQFTIVLDLADAQVTLDGSASTGPSAGLTYFWSAPGVVFDDPNSVTPTGVFPEGVTTATLTVMSPTGKNSSDQVNIMVKLVSVIANAGEDLLLETTGEPVQVTLDGSGSSVSEGETLSYFWSAPNIVFDDPTSITPTAIFPKGETSVDLTVTNSSGVSDRDLVVIRVKELLVAKAGEDQIVTAANSSGIAVTLDGSASTGPSPRSYSWSAPNVEFDDPASVTPTGIFPEGTTTATLTVTSPEGDVSTDDVDVTVKILPVVSWAEPEVSVAEDAGNVVLTMTLSKAFDELLYVVYATKDETANSTVQGGPTDGSAGSPEEGLPKGDSPESTTQTVDNRDYQAKNGTLVFNPGETSKSVSIVIYDDLAVEPEPHETFQVSSALKFNGTTLEPAYATVTILGVDANSAPVLAAIGAQTLPEDNALVLPLSASDANGDVLTFTAEATEKTVEIPGADFGENGGEPLSVLITGTESTRPGSVAAPELKVTPALNFNGEIEVTVTVADPYGGTDTATFLFTVTPINDPPVASVNMPAEILEDSEPVNGAITFVDPDGDTIILSIVSQPNGGTVTLESSAEAGYYQAITPGASLVFTPNPNFNGASPMTIAATDGEAVVTVEIPLEVTPVNDPVVFETTLSNQTMNEGDVQTIDVMTHDPDGTPIDLQFVGQEDPAQVARVLRDHLRLTTAVEDLQEQVDVLSEQLTYWQAQWDLYNSYANYYGLEAAKWVRLSESATTTSGSLLYTKKAQDAFAAESGWRKMAWDASQEVYRLQAEVNTMMVSLDGLKDELIEVSTELARLQAGNLETLSFISFNDNGDGTGRLTLSPGADHSGVYANLSVSAVDPEGEVVAQTFTLTVNDVTTVGELVVAQPVDPATGESPVSMTFDNVTVPGTTTVTTGEEGYALPTGFQLGDPAIYFELSTTAQFEGYIELSLYYGTMTFTDGQPLRLLHYENGAWQDVTTRVDEVNQVVYGRVASLSPFAIVEASTQAPELAVNNGLTVDEETTTTITNAVLQVTDGDSGPGELVYSVVEPPLVGDLQRNGVKLTVGDTFTQADIDAGQVAYSHLNDSVLKDFFRFNVTDGLLSLGKAMLFTVEITPVNDAPVIEVSAIFDVFEDQATGIPVNVLDSDVGNGSLTVSLAVNHGTLSLVSREADGGISLPESDPVAFVEGDGQADASLVFTGSLKSIVQALGGLEYTPLPEYNGSDVLTISVDDGGHTGAGGALSTSTTVDIAVLPLNDAPSFTSGDDVILDEDAGPQTIQNWATDIVAGPANEDQGLMFDVAVENPDLFTSVPAIDAATGALTFEAGPNVNGTFAVTVSLTDDGGTDVPQVRIPEGDDSGNVGDGSVDPVLLEGDPLVLAFDTSSSQTFTITVRAVNDAPVASAGDDQVVAYDGPETLVALDGSGSVDIDGDELTYVWRSNGVEIATGMTVDAVLGVGEHMLELTVSDGQISATDEVAVSVRDVTSPELTIISEFPDPIEISDPSGQEVMLRASTQDNYDETVEVIWKNEGETIGYGNEIVYAFGVGTHVVTVIAKDDSEYSPDVEATVTVMVVDTQAPELTASASVEYLWPANHKYETVTLNLAATDNGDANQITFRATVVSSEPDDAQESGKGKDKSNGDGNTAGDIRVTQVAATDPTQPVVLLSSNESPEVAFDPVADILELRAERAGNEIGRVYSISVIATDAFGNASDPVIVEVVVDHDQSASKPVASKPVLTNDAGVTFGATNIPNPFNPQTAIMYTLPEASDVRLVIYNVLGQQVRELVNAFQAPGQYSVFWNGLDAFDRKVSSGVYFYRLQADSNVLIKKMMLMK